ncbi:hypothetical protein ACFVS2_25225 [Brevibacillus sp. NPDC058079]|uniref:hypothetical protein n=1 Tax=Brevibacillus sp. NPDC058079 TaxID=3346330 RepID=UPI0036E4D18B
MSTNIYFVGARADLWGGLETFERRVYKHEVKETEKSYIFDNKRIAKEKLSKIEIVGDSTVEISCSTYTLETNLDQAKEDVVEAVRNHAKLRLSEMKRLYRLTESSPVETFKDKTSY